MTLLELAQEIGLNPVKHARHGGGEYICLCPNPNGCKLTGDDRFHLWPNEQSKRCVGRYWCRICGISGDTISFAVDIMGMTLDQASKRVNVALPEKPFIKTVQTRSFIPNAVTPPSRQWQEQAASFVEWAHLRILEEPDVLHWLSGRGLPIEAVKKYKIGWCNNEKRIKGYFKCDRSDWGLPEEQDKKGDVQHLYLPRGVVVPTFEKDGTVVRIKIRRSEWTPKSKFSKYKELPGSMNGLNIIGNTGNPIMTVVESELDAFAIDYRCHDFAFAVAVGSNTKNPDNVTDYLAQRKTLLICRDNDDAGKTMFYKWHKLYMHASEYYTPVGKDIGEFIQQGNDVRKWLLDAVPGLNLT